MTEVRRIASCIYMGVVIACKGSIYLTELTKWSCVMCALFHLIYKKIIQAVLFCKCTRLKSSQ